MNPKKYEVLERFQYSDNGYQVGIAEVGTTLVLSEKMAEGLIKEGFLKPIVEEATKEKPKAKSKSTKKKTKPEADKGSDFLNEKLEFKAE